VWVGGGRGGRFICVDTLVLGLWGVSGGEFDLFFSVPLCSGGSLLGPWPAGSFWQVVGGY